MLDVLSLCSNEEESGRVIQQTGQPSLTAQDQQLQQVVYTNRTEASR